MSEQATNGQTGNPPLVMPPDTPPAGGPARWGVPVVGHIYSLATLAAFMLYGALALGWPGGTGASLALAGLLGMVALWFIYCVIGDAEAKCHSLFTFAYAFTFGAFALLLMPVLADKIAQRPQADGSTAAPSAAQTASQTEGALRLVRGCVVSRGSGSPPTLSERLAPCPPPAGASAPGLPEGIAATGYRYGWLVSVGGVTARTLAVTSCAIDSGTAARLSEEAQAAESKASAASSPTNTASAVAAREAAQKAVALKTASCAAQGTDDPKRPFVEVSGGVAVPLFVVVLALIGGAVSISRRIPEFQRRNDSAYVPTADEPAMPAFRVRESVVFQIMQLVSAPFLAIATMQVIEPNNVASASTLAFATGFFSETILYMIRGMVNGLKPELTKVAGAAFVNITGRLSWDGDPGDPLWSKVRVELRPSGAGEWRSVPVERDGRFAVNAVAPGRYQLFVMGPGITAPPGRDIEVDSKPPAAVEIAVKKA